MSIAEFVETLNRWSRIGIPYLFLVDFEMEKPVVFRLSEIDPERLMYDINGLTNSPPRSVAKRNIDFIKVPPSFSDYKEKYDKVRTHLAYGDSYLTNLTMKTEIRTELSLHEIFLLSQAKYKVLFDAQFLVFSPETFITIKDRRITARPMKGTIDASLPDAEKTILADRKEMAEHVTIVDLIRNDLSSVAKNVRVANFRYVEKITTIHKDLFQVSSEITGELPDDYLQHLGDIILKLLPAGSVSGAPKRKTVEIIKEAEQSPRGYYTGVVGIFDGKALDSGVMIRFIEDDRGKLCYRSGGGITMQSAVEAEYQETIDKVYVPLD